MVLARAISRFTRGDLHGVLQLTGGKLKTKVEQLALELLDLGRKLLRDSSRMNSLAFILCHHPLQCSALRAQ